jgi:hypothetical protein
MGDKVILVGAVEHKNPNRVVSLGSGLFFRLSQTRGERQSDEQDSKVFVSEPASMFHADGRCNRTSLLVPQRIPRPDSWQVPTKCRSFLGESRRAAF